MIHQNFNEVILHPPGGVAINQWKDGSIHFKCGPAGYLPLSQLLMQLAVQCETYHHAYNSALQEQAQQQAAAPAPAAQARIAEMEAEIARLRGGGIPVSVNTNPQTQMHPAQQLAAAVATKAPVTVAMPGPSLLEVDAAIRTHGIQHPVAAMMQAPVAAPILPPAVVPPQPMIPPHIPSVNMANANPGPALAGTSGVNPRIAQLEQELRSLRAVPPAPPQGAAPALPEGTVHMPVLKILAQQAAQAGSASPDAPGTIISGGREVDDGELGAPPASI